MQNTGWKALLCLDAADTINECHSDVYRIQRVLALLILLVFVLGTIYMMLPSRWLFFFRRQIVQWSAWNPSNLYGDTDYFTWKPSDEAVLAGVRQPIPPTKEQLEFVISSRSYALVTTPKLSIHIATGKHMHYPNLRHWKG